MAYISSTCFDMSATFVLNPNVYHIMYHTYVPKLKGEKFYEPFLGSIWVKFGNRLKVNYQM